MTRDLGWYMHSPMAAHSHIMPMRVPTTPGLGDSCGTTAAGMVTRGPAVKPQKIAQTSSPASDDTPIQDNKTIVEAPTQMDNVLSGPMDLAAIAEMKRLGNVAALVIANR